MDFAGVYYRPDCYVREIINHAVLIVGYGTDPKHGDYWLAKNSFGETWGEEGYLRIARNKYSHCNIALVPLNPIIG